MKTRLEEFTIGEFVELMAGEKKILGHSTKSPKEIDLIVRDIIMEYRAIVDPNGTKSYLLDNEDIAKAKNRVLLFSICNMLADMKQFDHIREIMNTYGLSVDRMSDSRLKAEMKGKLAKAKNTLKRVKADNTAPQQDFDVRKDFDEQTAALMAHFKFQIDMSSMKATLYAHLVARFQREIKAQQEALKRMK